MLLALFSKPWWKSNVRDDQSADENRSSSVAAIGSEPGRELSASEPSELEGAPLCSTRHGETHQRSPIPSVFPAGERDESRDDQSEYMDAIEGESEEVGDEESAIPSEIDGDVDLGQDDPLAPAYDLEFGEPIPRSVSERARSRVPPRRVIESAKEFFATEILYRFDILDVQDRDVLKGKYRVEVRGNRGGIWTVTIADELEVVNRREEADVVFSLQQVDFLEIVNGDLNPQMAILSQKMLVQGDIRKVTAFLALLTPEEG